MSKDPIADATVVEEPVEATTTGAVGAPGASSSPSAVEPTPPGEEVVIAPDETIWRALDRHDEEQIVAEVTGRALDVMLYSFEQDGKKLTDLSYAGVLEAVRVMNARHEHTCIRIRPDVLHERIVEVEGNPYYEFTVYAENAAAGGGQFGTARQATHKQLRRGGSKLDHHARTIALNKAQRNALKTLVPEELRQTIIAAYLGDERRVKHVATGSDPLRALPAPLVSPEADELRHRIDEAYAAVRQMPGGMQRVPPGRMYGLKQRNAHSLDGLAETLQYLAEVMAELEAAQAAKDGDENG